MKSAISIAPKSFGDAVLSLIDARAESAGCSPGEALRLLLNELAAALPTEGGFEDLEFPAISQQPTHLRFE
jgi:hypothetical protein